MGSFVSSFAPPATAASASSGPSRVQAFHSSSEWKNHLTSIDESTLMVVDFSATWCGPCRMIEPVFVELSTRYTDVTFVKIDVDELSDVAQEFSVQAMPTFVLYKKGKQVDKVVGAKKDELQKKIELHRARA